MLRNVLLRDRGLIPGATEEKTLTILVSISEQCWRLGETIRVLGYNSWVCFTDTVVCMLNLWVLQAVDSMILWDLDLFMTIGPFCSTGWSSSLIEVQKVLTLMRRTAYAELLCGVGKLSPLAACSSTVVLRRYFCSSCIVLRSFCIVGIGTL